MDHAGGRLAKAEEHAQEALRRKLKSGERDEQLAQILTALGAIRLERGAASKARKDALEAIDVLGDFEPPGESRDVDRGRVRGLCLLGRCHIEEGNFAEARPLLERALTLVQHCLEPVCEELVEVLMAMGLLCQEAGYALEAEEYYRAALTATETLHGPMCGEAATICQRLALLAESAQDPESLQPFAQRAYEIRCSDFGSGHPYTASAQSALACVLDAIGEEREAGEKYLHAIAIFDQHLASSHADECPLHPDMVRAYDQCRRGAAKHLVAHGRAADAREFSTRAQQVIERVFGRSHRFVENCRRYHQALQRAKGGGRKVSFSAWDWWRSLSFGR
ncbi:MAG: tetratricopeptide repeat protein [Bryobacterales bacterium]|nr:tetratricopeptide repeat protein [Bryobacterales bacterium]